VLVNRKSHGPPATNFFPTIFSSPAMARKTKAGPSTTAPPPAAAAAAAVEDPTSEAALANPRRHIRVEAERVRDVSSVDYPGHFPDEDHSWDLDRFKKVRALGPGRRGELTDVRQVRV
jgi:hypothetical protein